MIRRLAGAEGEGKAGRVCARDAVCVHAADLVPTRLRARCPCARGAARWQERGESGDAQREEKRCAHRSEGRLILPWPKEEYKAA